MLENSQGREKMEQLFQDSSQRAESFLHGNQLNLGAPQ